MDKYLLNLAGEYRVCAEFFKRGVFATITYGNCKGADILAVNHASRKTAIIEVKAASRPHFVTSFYQKYKTRKMPHPDFWVLYSVTPESDGGFEEKFFILTHREVANAQAKINAPGLRMTYEKMAERVAKGVDNVDAKHVIAHENRWDKIVRFLGQE